MTSRKEPAYIHAILLLVAAGLVYLLIRVAILDPQNILEQEKFFKEESRLRMINIKEAEVLYKNKFGKFSDSFDSLFAFINTDETIQSKKDSIFLKLKSGTFIVDSLQYSPKSHSRYILQIDTSTSIDTVVTKGGKFLRVDTTITIGNRYYLECPDGYGSIGDLKSDAKINVPSWGQ
jgi:hypothetical protein